MTNPKIETDLAEILLEIKSDIKELKKDSTDIKSELGEIKIELAVVKNNQNNFKEQLSEIKGTQKAQIWSLITLIAGTLITIAVALFKAK